MSARTKTWSDLVGVRARFHRSTHLERDFEGADWLRGYVVTPLARTIVSRVGNGLLPGRTSRAWSLTGPYGAGKSAFSLFLSHILGRASDPSCRLARNLLKEADLEGYNSFFGKKSGVIAPFEGLHPVLITGQPVPIERLMLEGLARSLDQFWAKSTGKPDILHEVRASAARAANGKVIPTRDIVSLFERASVAIKKSQADGSGILIILDEAGRVLEQAAKGSVSGDIHLLQELAEAAARSGDTPIVLVVTLHQSFEAYAARLSTARRSEWAKIQGRFEDIAFSESADQVVRLIGAALDIEDTGPNFKRQARECADAVAALRRTQSGADLPDLLKQVLPLHPTTALALGPLFKSRLAQNERSLFAFLSGTEPRGFQAHLSNSPVSGQVPWFTLDHLYDYVTSAFGSRLYSGGGHGWALVDGAIRRLPKAAHLIDERVLKSIGILGLFGEQMGLLASEEVLTAALAADREGASEVQMALERLQAASLIVFRKYQNAFALWEGSDLDLDALVEQAHRKVDTTRNLPARLTRIAPPRPVLARKHLFDTGTLRYFEVRYVGDEVFEAQDLPSLEGPSDGVILLVISAHETSNLPLAEDPTRSLRFWQLVEAKKPVLVGRPRDCGKIRQLAADLLALEYVRVNTPELQHDPVARRELTSRISEAERSLRAALDGILVGTEDCAWESRLGTSALGRALTRHISLLCDQAFAKAPIIHNELINRRELSSAAAAAQRSLMQAMLRAAFVPRLGIVGNPPELSMYRSLLEASAIHAQRSGEWSIGEPTGRLGSSFAPAWKCIDDVLSQESRVKVSEIYERLGSTPIGMKAGPRPVVLLAFLLAKRDDIAIYEDGAFVSEVSDAFIERLLRAPTCVELQLLEIRGGRAAALEEMQKLLRDARPGKTTLVNIAAALTGFASSLPSYSKHTRRISDTARNVRDVLLRAKDPAKLIFEELPKALGQEPLAAAHLNEQVATGLVGELRAKLRELQNALPQLLDEIRRSIAESLGYDGGARDFRVSAQHRAACALEFAGEVSLRAFLSRLGDAKLAEGEWIQSLGTLLAGKPPTSWNDQDVERFKIQLARVSQSMSVAESLAMARGRSGGGDQQLVRVSVATSGGVQLDSVVALAPTSEAQVREVRDRLIELVRTTSLSRDGSVAALALACQVLLSELASSKSRNSSVGA